MSNRKAKSSSSKQSIPQWAFWLAAGLVVTCSVVMADYFRTIPEDVVATYVGRSSCIECHQSEAAAYDQSHHDKAMDFATDETVIGDFNNATIEHDGLTSRMFREGQRFMIHTEGPTGKMEDFEVKYVFGVDPLQQYMVEFDRGPATLPDEIARVQVLRISWDTHRKRWFYLRPPDVKDKLEPNDPLHWTGIAQRWQTMCADCHSTNLRTGFDTTTLAYHTTYSEIDVSCESCHGPGSVHVDLARSKRLFWDRKRGYALAKLKGENSEPQLQTCAQCHSRRGLIEPGFVAGDNYHDHFQLGLLTPETYFDDGQIKDEVYVYGSFVQSKMYHKNIRCTDCHDPHSLKLKQPDNQTCTSCHQHSAGKYDVPSHHHHVVGSEGAKCVNCHMPGRTYMDVDFRRDHSLRVPRPDLSVKLGTPNACTDCHLKDRLDKVPAETKPNLREYADWLQAAESGDKVIAELLKQTDSWSDQACERWYGSERKQPEHYGEALAAFRRGDADGAKRLLELATRKDGLTPFLARATALESLASARVSGCSVAAMQLMDDPSDHPLVRAAAIPCLAEQPPTAIRRSLLPKLADAASQVRLAAAQMLAEPAVYQSLTANERTQVDLALREYQEMLAASADRSGAHLAWAGLCEQRGMVPDAIAAYETAIRVEPNMAGARTNLAAIYDQLAQRGDGRATQRAVVLRSQELPLLRRDAALAPENASIQYRYGLALYLQGNHADALVQLEKAAKLEPEVEDFGVAVKLLKEKMLQVGK